MNDDLNLYPIFNENSTAIVFSSSNYFVPYLTTAICSLVVNSVDEYTYDICVLHKDISTSNQKEISTFISKKNISIRFVDISSMKNLNKFKEVKIGGHLSIETYFRILIPIIFKNYKKALFLDSDIIILEDVQKLCEMDLGEYPLAATEESLLSGQMGPDGRKKDRYYSQFLGIKDIDRYFQAGVLLINLESFRKNDYTTLLIKNSIEKHYHLADQDALNELFWNSYLQIDKSWNWTPLQKQMKNADYLLNMAPAIRERYLSTYNPKIIHFADRNKPWLDAEEDYATLWWKYARQTPFYELALARLSQALVRQKELTAIWCSLQGLGFYIRMVRYAILTKVASGKKREHWAKKYEHCLAIMRKIKSSKKIKLDI